MKSKLVKGQRASASDVSSAGASGKDENPPVITKEAGQAVTPYGRATGKGRSHGGKMAHDGTGKGGY